MRMRYIAPVAAVAVTAVGVECQGSWPWRTTRTSRPRRSATRAANSSSSTRQRRGAWASRVRTPRWTSCSTATSSTAVPTSLATGNTFSGSQPAPAGAVPGERCRGRGSGRGQLGQRERGRPASTVPVTIPTEPCVPPDLSTGRFTGGGHQLRVGEARVTRGLTIHCDLLLSNNLEVNWGGNQFHMTEHLTTVECTDDPNISQAPPPAPLDTLIGVGTGRYNGPDGYTIEFTLVDYGEPGRDDQAALRIYETANPSNVVLNVPCRRSPAATSRPTTTSHTTDRRDSPVHHRGWWRRTAAGVRSRPGARRSASSRARTMPTARSVSPVPPGVNVRRPQRGAPALWSMTVDPLVSLRTLRAEYRAACEASNGLDPPEHAHHPEASSSGEARAGTVP